MEEKLIEFIKENDIFYNKRNKNYKNIYLKDKKMEELSKQINVPAKKLKDRWRSLKDKFYRDIKAMKLPSGSGANTPKKKWKWMDSLMFLNDADFMNENTSGNFSRSDGSYEENLYPEFLEDSMASEDLFFPPDIDDDTGASSTSTPKPKKKQNSVERMMYEAKREMTDFVNLAKESLVEPALEPQKTSSDMFFESLAKQTNEANLSAKQTSELQLELLKCFHTYMYKK